MGSNDVIHTLLRILSLGMRLGKVPALPIVSFPDSRRQYHIRLRKVILRSIIILHTYVNESGNETTLPTCVFFLHTCTLYNEKGEAFSHRPYAFAGRDGKGVAPLPQPLSYFSACLAAIRHFQRISSSTLRIQSWF